jgi:hypothetical protein
VLQEALAAALQQVVQLQKQVDNLMDKAAETDAAHVAAMKVTTVAAAEDKEAAAMDKAAAAAAHAAVAASLQKAQQDLKEEVRWQAAKRYDADEALLVSADQVSQLTTAYNDLNAYFTAVLNRERYSSAVSPMATLPRMTVEAVKQLTGEAASCQGGNANVFKTTTSDEQPGQAFKIAMVGAGAAGYDRMSNFPARHSNRALSLKVILVSEYTTLVCCKCALVTGVSTVFLFFMSFHVASLVLTISPSSLLPSPCRMALRAPS